MQPAIDQLAEQVIHKAASRFSDLLVVGLGGGTIPMFMRSHLPDSDIDVIEPDPAVVDVTRSHFGFRDAGTGPRARTASGQWPAVLSLLCSVQPVVFAPSVAIST